MINANELRIGNWVIFENIPVQISLGHFGYIGESGEKDFDCNPIPLTEEWLLKFEFEKVPIVAHENSELVFIINKKKNYSQQIKLSYFEFSGKDLDGYYFERFHPYDLYVKYVHQLQNLYFALTGEELTVKKEETVL